MCKLELVHVVKLDIQVIHLIDGHSQALVRFKLLIHYSLSSSRIELSRWVKHMTLHQEMLATIILDHGTLSSSRAVTNQSLATSS